MFTDFVKLDVAETYQIIGNTIQALSCIINNQRMPLISVDHVLDLNVDNFNHILKIYPSKYFAFIGISFFEQNSTDMDLILMKKFSQDICQSVAANLGAPIYICKESIMEECELTILLTKDIINKTDLNPNSIIKVNTIYLLLIDGIKST